MHRIGRQRRDTSSTHSSHNAATKTLWLYNLAMAAHSGRYFLTTHFWGPVANWGFVVAGLSEIRKDPERISGRMTAVLCFYSMLFMRFAVAVQPRNMLLFSCHLCNSTVQAAQLYRLYSHRKSQAIQASS